MEFTEYDVRLAAYALILDRQDRILLTWYRGGARDGPGWSLPGGGVDFEESLEAAVVREAKEETGYDVVVGAPLLTHSFTEPVGPSGRPYKSSRVIFAATIVGGTLGTLEVGGSTLYAAWVPLTDLTPDPTRAPLIDLALAAWQATRP